MRGLASVAAAAALAPLAHALMIPQGEMARAFERARESRTGAAAAVADIDAGLDAAKDGFVAWLNDAAAAAAAVDGSDDVEDATSDWGALTADDVAALGEDALASLEESVLALFSGSGDAGDERRHHHPPPHDPHHDHPPTEHLTAWQLLEKTEHASRFHALVKEYPSLVDALNSTDSATNYTVFVPTDRAFEKTPPPSDDADGEGALEDFLRNHVVPGNVRARDMWHRNTLPTLLEEKLLGGEHQRLRVRFGLRGVNVNVHSRVIVSDVIAKNGVLHAVDVPITRPDFIGKTIANNPSMFSTLLYAYEKTDFVKFIHGVEMAGSTVFMPTNGAFSRLGQETNRFLFQTDKGRKILTAMLKYQIVADTTLYSDAAYGKLEQAGDDEEVGADGGRSTHYELKTLYDNKGLGVDIWRWGGWTRLTVNGHIGTSFVDGVQKNGVIHVVNQVPLPPCPRGGHGDGESGEVSVESLLERFAGLLEEEEEQGPNEDL